MPLPLREVYDESPDFYDIEVTLDKGGELSALSLQLFLSNF